MNRLTDDEARQTLRDWRSLRWLTLTYVAMACTALFVWGIVWLWPW